MLAVSEKAMQTTTSASGKSSAWRTGLITLVSSDPPMVSQVRRQKPIRINWYLSLSRL